MKIIAKDPHFSLVIFLHTKSTFVCAANPICMCSVYIVHTIPHSQHECTFAINNYLKLRNCVKAMPSQSTFFHFMCTDGMWVCGMLYRLAFSIKTIRFFSTSTDTQRQQRRKEKKSHTKPNSFAPQIWVWNAWNCMYGLSTNRNFQLDYA